MPTWRGTVYVEDTTIVCIRLHTKATNSVGPEGADSVDTVFTPWHGECIVCSRMETSMTQHASWNVIVNGVTVWTGGLARAKREAAKRGGIIRPSDTVTYARI